VARGQRAGEVAQGVYGSSRSAGPSPLWMGNGGGLLQWPTTAVLSLVMTAIPQASAGRLAEVRNLIAEQGARQALWRLFDDDAAWDSLLNQIASGRRDWLSVASQLRRVSDAHASETLDMAIQEALPRNPVGVLDLVAAGAFSAQGACGMYGFGQIEDERPPPVLIRLVDRRIAAVSAVKKTSLLGVRDGCLRELESLRKVLSK
jgi:hypothetical protein